MWVLVVLMCGVGAPEDATCKALTGPPREPTPIFNSEEACDTLGVEVEDILRQRTEGKGYIIQHRCVSFAELV